MIRVELSSALKAKALEAKEQGWARPGAVGCRRDGLLASYACIHACRRTSTLSGYHIISYHIVSVDEKTMES